jgi:predicted nucleotidyltransferase
MLSLKPSHFQILKNILGEYYETAYVFGSFAIGSQHFNSDFDLCLKITLSPQKMFVLKDEIMESNFPFIVDLSLFSSFSVAFKRVIEPSLVKLSEFEKNLNQKNS